MQRREFEKMAMRIRPLLLNTGRMMLGRDDEAEDAAQEALLRLWQIRDRLERYQPIDRFAWAVARNICISKLRKRHISGVPLADWMEKNGSSAAFSERTPQWDVEEQENDRWLTEQIEGLPASQMLIMQMSQGGRMSNSEIAALLGKTEATVRSTLSKARKNLLQKLKEKPE
jgi:RNA polymerase sigma-70 factor (ECF subfamily)